VNQVLSPNLELSESAVGIVVNRTPVYKGPSANDGPGGEFIKFEEDPRMR